MRRNGEGARKRAELEARVEAALEALDRGERGEREGMVKAKVVVIGGGTGLSTVLGSGEGGAGLARTFSQVHAVVCTTDDGGSTGELVRRLPMIGIGDFRKVMLSLMRDELLEKRYGAGRAGTAREVLRAVFSHRFGGKAPGAEAWTDPVSVLGEAGAGAPEAVKAALRGLTAGIPRKVREAMERPGHCFGNLLMTAAVFRAAGWETGQAPGAGALEAGLGEVADVLGVERGSVSAASAVPGTLVYEYANGVTAAGQTKAARTRRRCAVGKVRIAFAGAARAGAGLLKRLREADLIVYAPGSLYSSMLPVMLTPGVADAIRANRHAVKILGANLWIQEGETDMSFRERSRGFWVSELVEAYGRNVEGGTEGLVDAVLSASLDSVPGSVIQSYAMEDKHPIHLDRRRVEALGVLAVEARLFRADGPRGKSAMLHHDAARFAAAVREMYAVLAKGKPMGRGGTSGGGVASASTGGGTVRRAETTCGRMDACLRRLDAMRFEPEELRVAAEEFVQANPDVTADHLGGVSGVRAVKAEEWARSEEWDNIAGYFEPESGEILLHERVVGKEAAFRANFAIALGESLLGCYVGEKRWKKGEGMRTYEIEVRGERERGGLFGDEEMRRYLRLAKMRPAGGGTRCWRRTVSVGEGFLPSGILFGLMYAWYLDNRYAPTLSLEMEMLQWPPSQLLPHQARERARYRELVAFLRERVFTGFAAVDKGKK